MYRRVCDHPEKPPGSRGLGLAVDGNARGAVFNALVGGEMTGQREVVSRSASRKADE